MQVAKNKRQASKRASTPLKLLTLAITSVLASTVVQADVNKKMIGDLEIYRAPNQGGATLMMMLDTSGSMGYIPAKYDAYGYYHPSYSSIVQDFDKNNNFMVSSVSGWSGFRYDSSQSEPCRYKRNDGYVGRSNVVTGNITIPHIKKDGLPSGDEYTFAVRGCYGDGGTIEFDSVTGNVNTEILERIDRLQIGLISLLADETQLDNANKIGIGHYSYNGDNKKGVINQPSKPLTTAHRKKLIESIMRIGVEPKGGTPSAHAYAEAGAYMMGTTTYSQSYFYESGTPNSDASTKVNPSANNSSQIYKSPIIDGNQCAGNGIYFLTDGSPNGSDYHMASNLMNKSLGISNGFVGTVVTTQTNRGSWDSYDTDCTSSGFEVLPKGGAWRCMAEYSKKLRDKSNPSGVAIKTAAVGFGSLFAPNGVVPTKNHPKYPNDPTKKLTNCDVMDDINAKNLCKLSEKSYGYGEGGFTATSTPEGIKKSLLKFLGNLKPEIAPIPSGVIVVPDDPYSATSQQAIAFYPSIKAKVDKADAIWPGNMKKYNLKEGTLYGKNDVRLFMDFDDKLDELSKTGQLNPQAQDLWSEEDYPNANNAIASGGFYALLNSGTGIASQRTVYLEDWNNATDKKPAVRLLSVDSAGKVNLDGNPIATDNTFIDTATYTNDKIKTLIRFLGFKDLPSGLIKDMILTDAKIESPTRILGASIHSAPALASFSADTDDNGTITGNRDDYVLFGSMDGALHMVDADNQDASNGGKEKFAFIPREIVKNQASALESGGQNVYTGIPSMGMDAPWLVTADYKLDVEHKTVKSKNMYAYGGLRMGGSSFYGLDLSNSNGILDANNLSNRPKILFSLSSEKSGFKRMGQIWSKPVKAKIRMTNTPSDKGRDVLIFGGGYDTCYEDEEYQVGTTTSSLTNQSGQACNRTTSIEARGNAVYMVYADGKKAGQLIWSASSSNGSTNTNKVKVDDMKHSIVGEVTTLDRNGDGFMDNLYFADLGGQVFRADFQNAGFLGASAFTPTRVEKVLESAFNGTDAQYALRFYERPIVSFYRNNENKMYALVNVISGDRSSPLSKMRTDNAKADRLYGIMDFDITKPNTELYGTGTETPTLQSALTSTDLYELPTSIGTSGTYSKAEKKVITDGLEAGTKKGWYYPLTRFDGFNKVRYTKGVGKSEIMGGYLFTTTYNPDMKYAEAGACSAEVVGGSERQLYCLPYGICMDDTSKNGRGGFIRAGRGIQELTIGPRGSGGSGGSGDAAKAKASQRTLIGTRTLTEQLSGRVDFNSGGQTLTESKLAIDQKAGGNDDITVTGGDGTAPPIVVDQRYILTPNTWYESNEN